MLEQTDLEFPVAEPYPAPTEENVRGRIKSLYHQPSKWVVIALASIAVTLLASAVFLQLRNAENYWYQPMVSIYSLLAGIFVVSRFIIAAFYLPPKNQGYEPTLTILVPCMNEGDAIRQTIERIFVSGYPREKLEVIAVNDGSTDNTFEEMRKAQSRNPNLVIVDFEKNRGLCHGWGIAMSIARGEFIICVDSDTFIFPGSLNKIVQGCGRSREYVPKAAI